MLTIRNNETMNFWLNKFKNNKIEIVKWNNK